MVEVNLLPTQYRKQTQPNAWKYATWALLPITAAALLIPWIMTSSKTGNLQRQIDAVQGNIDTLTPQKNDYDGLVKQQKDLEQVTTIAQTLRDQKTYWSNDLAAFSAQLPANSGVGLTQMNMTAVSTDASASNQKNGLYNGKNVRRQIVVTGKASSEQAVINFLNTFENSPNFGVQFQSMTRKTDDNTYDFNATVGVVGTASATEAASGTAAPASGTSTPAATTANAPALSPAARTATVTGDSNVK